MSALLSEGIAVVAGVVNRAADCPYEGPKAVRGGAGTLMTQGLI